MNIFGYLFAILLYGGCVAFIFLKLYRGFKTGKMDYVGHKSNQSFYSREKNPIKFWMLTLLYLTFTVAPIYLLVRFFLAKYT